MRKFLYIVYDEYLIITLILVFIILTLTLYSIDPLANIPDYDKFYHLIAFSLLSFPVSVRRPPFFIYACLSFILLGGLTELLQPYFNRDPELADFLFNVIGISTGVLSGTFARKYIFCK